MAADRVSRTKTIDGIVTPAFIHNGPSFFFVDLPVFADGLVDCWELLDLALFRDRLRSGWVTPHPSDPAEVSVHGLAAWTTAGGRWELDADGLFERVLALVRQLNPRMENLHDCHGRTVEMVGDVRVSILAMSQARPVRVVDPKRAFSERVPGDRLSVLVHDGEYHLASLRVFADGVVELGRLPSPEALDVAALRAMVEAGRIVGSVPEGARVHIHGLGSFVVQAEHYGTDPREQLREVSDLLDKLNGRPGSIARCRTAYETYLADPTVAHREALRAAYEAVPEHNRRYVGDMDTKDVGVRMILYGEKEIEGWSHRVVARASGEKDLPEIRVPKPKDE
ncbi:hypothetical protein WME73_41780 [Sorangium sp. So ce302]|uniref:DUF7638 domain-containing protein n=1 Tax=Sorangium sp. So ce302 TaxID=3133297 RepID=UPI003F5FFAD8